MNGIFDKFIRFLIYVKVDAYVRNYFLLLEEGVKIVHYRQREAFLNQLEFT